MSKRIATNEEIKENWELVGMLSTNFDFEIATPTGKPVVFEMWAFLNKGLD